MTVKQLQTCGIEKEFRFKTARSGGKGGQHVNKVESKVLLMFGVDESQVLSAEQKDLVKAKLAARISEEGYLQVTEESDRSQLKNKELAIKKMLALLAKCFVKVKARKASKIPKSVKEKRIKDKKQRGEVKKLRGKLTK